MQPGLKHKLLAGGLAATAVLGVGAIAGAASGVGPFDSDDSTSFAGSGSSGTGGTAATEGTAATQAGGGSGEIESRQLVDLPIGAIQTFTAGPAGTVTVARGDGSLAIAGIGPAAGFVIDEREAVGREVEVRFVSGGLVVRFDAELEDGVVRIRVRQRGTTASSLTPATVDERDGDDRGGDDDNSGPGSGDDDSGNSGSGSGSGSSGHGGRDD